tara:strand:- start:189 stop:485 length:297 start_codon:yes stop_codon:yes gene_type:complete
MVLMPLKLRIKARKAKANSNSNAKPAKRRAAFERKQASFVTYHVDDPAFADLRQETRPHDFSKTWDIDYTRIVLRPADFRIRSLLRARLARASREADK